MPMIAAPFPAGSPSVSHIVVCAASAGATILAAVGPLPTSAQQLPTLLPSVPPAGGVSPSPIPPLLPLSCGTGHTSRRFRISNASTPRSERCRPERSRWPGHSRGWGAGCQTPGGGPCKGMVQRAIQKRAIQKAKTPGRNTDPPLKRKCHSPSPRAVVIDRAPSPESAPGQMHKPLPQLLPLPAASSVGAATRRQAPPSAETSQSQRGRHHSRACRAASL
jgi:hypothetical protein